MPRHNSITSSAGGKQRKRTTSFNNNDRSNSGGSLRSPPGSNSNSNSNQNNNHTKSRLHMMSAKGFTQEHEMSAFHRLYKFIRLPSFSEYFMSVDHHQIWRRHLAWSLRDGDHLRNAVTSRFASNMVFMSLLLGTEIGVLFSPSKPADTFRAALKAEAYNDVNFWAAIVLCISIGLTLSTLVANFTAWAIIGAVSPHNSHAILRSSVGLDAAQLPARLVILSIYCFVVWIFMFIYILLPHIWGFVIALIPVGLISYIVILYSSFGRLVIYSRAMQSKGIFKGGEDHNMSSRRLFEELLIRAEKEKSKKSPLPLYYRSKRELSEKISEMRVQEDEEYVDMGFESEHAGQYVSRILDASGHHEALSPALSEDLSRSFDEGSPGRQGSNGFIPQSISGDSEQPISNEGERRDSLPPLEHSTRNVQGSSGRWASSRQGMRRGPSDRRSLQRGPGESSRSILQNNNNCGPATMSLTL